MRTRLETPIGVAACVSCECNGISAEDNVALNACWCPFGQRRVRCWCGGGLAGLGGLLEPDLVDGLGGGEDVFGLGVSVGLPGEPAEGVLFEPVVVESFSGVVVVDDPVGRFCRGAELVLDASEELGGLEVLVDDKGPSLGPFELRVDGEDDLLVALERLGGG